MKAPYSPKVANKTLGGKWNPLFSNAFILRLTAFIDCYNRKINHTLNGIFE